MVTIIESMTRCLNDKIPEPPVQALQQALSQARLVLFQTPEMLPILARAGVIDSGALGFIMIFEGLYIGLSPEEELPEESEEPYRFTPDKKTTPPPQEDTTQYQYCTELTLTKHGDVDTSGLHDFLTSRGDSIALMDESKIIKLHIHCNEPEQILKEMESYGTITRKRWKTCLPKFFKVPNPSKKAIMQC
jgi:dihydroxyacetone kinase-like predicted kinase